MAGYFALIIGINEYHQLRSLQKANDDALAVKKVLVEQGGYKAEHVKLLQGQHATKSTLNQALQWLARETGPDDTVIIFFSGHGVRPIGGYESDQEFLCTFEANPFALRETALSNQEFTTALSAIRADKLVVLLDACHAGGVGELEDPNRALRNGFSKKVYANLRQGKGRVIISSCQPDQVSWELPGIPNGLFTHHLLRGLQNQANISDDGVIHIFDLFQYLSEAIPKTCSERGVPMQNPLFESNLRENFPIARVPMDVEPSASLFKSGKISAWSVADLRGHTCFHQVVNLLQRGKAIFVVGPEISAEVGLPTVEEYETYLKHYAIERDIEVDPDASFAEVAVTVEEALGRERLARVILGALLKTERRLKREKGADYAPHARGAYRLLPVLSKFTKALLTTNWDGLLRCAMKMEEPSLSDLHIGTHSGPAPPIFELLGNREKPGDMLVANFTCDEVLSKVQSDSTRDRLWDTITDPAADYHFIFLGYKADQQIITTLQNALLGKQRSHSHQDHFFVAPLSPKEETDILVDTGMTPIPAKASDMLLALFQELCQFIDREQEQDMVFNVEKTQFIEFYGDFGSGKTALLNTVAQRAEVEGWTPARILNVSWTAERGGKLQALVRGKDPAYPQRVTLSGFVQLLRKGDGVFLIFDNTERLSIPNLTKILDAVAPEILRLNAQNCRSLLLVGGRHEVPAWPRGVYRSQYSNRLPPLEDAEVEGMAMTFLLAARPHSQERFSGQLITDIQEISCGHPSFVKAILADLTTAQPSEEILLPKHLTFDEKQNYLQRFNADVDAHINWSDAIDIKGIYERRLCVYRKFNREILGKIESLETDLWSYLGEINILEVKRYESTNDVNLITRQIKSVKLKYVDRESFIDAHREAEEIFKASVKTNHDDVQRAYMLEFLFHTASRLLVEVHDKSERCKRLTNLVKPLNFRILRDIPSTGFGHMFVGKINRDVELSRLLETCIGTSCLKALLQIYRNMGVVDV
jgi:hypothetical protein